ncbi:hypothetical protein Tco_0361216 [Tanacetum coccineum]
MTPASDGGVEIKIGVSDEFPTPASDGGLSDNSDPDLTDTEEENVEREEDLFKAYEARKKELEDNLLKKKADVLLALEEEERETELKARAEELMGPESDYIKRLNELAAHEKLSELKLESDFIEREKILLDKKENLVETQRALMNMQGGMAKDWVTIQQMLLGRWKKNVEKEKILATLEADLGARAAELEAREADLIHRENDIILGYMSAVRPHADMQYCLHALARRLPRFLLLNSGRGRLGETGDGSQFSLAVLGFSESPRTKMLCFDHDINEVGVGIDPLTMYTDGSEINFAMHSWLR